MSWTEIGFGLLVGTGIFLIGRVLYGILLHYTKWVQNKTLRKLLERSERDAETVVRSVVHGSNLSEHKITELIISVNAYGDRRSQQENQRLGTAFNKMFATAQKQAEEKNV